MSLKGDATSRFISFRGHDWSRFAVSMGTVAYASTTPSTAHGIVFYSIPDDSVEPSNSGQRYVGNPLRCLSTAVEGEESGS